MKIFDWIHRNRHHNMDYCKVSHRKDNFEAILENGDRMVAEETDALLVELICATNLHHVLDSTILTIGTFGIDQLTHLNTTDYQDEEFHCNHELGEEPKAVPQHVAEKKAMEVAGEIVEEEKAGKKSEIVKEEKMAVSVIAVKKDAAVEEENLLEPLLKEKKEERRERTTLLDLFMESDALAKRSTSSRSSRNASGFSKDSAQEKEGSIATKTMAAMMASQSRRAKDGKPSSLKKLASRKKGEVDLTSAASKKLSRLLTKMMRKRIHPEVEDEVQTSSEENRTAGQKREDKNGSINESISLLW